MKGSHGDLGKLAISPLQLGGQENSLELNDFGPNSEISWQCEEKNIYFTNL